MGMTIKEPIIVRSEISNEIYILDGKDKYCVTDEVLAAVFAGELAIPKADYEQRLKVDIVDKSVDEGYLYDWYISSVTEDEPKWTEAHVKELVNDFYLIPKQEEEDADN